MKKDAPINPADVEKAASLYSLGKLSIEEAAKIANSFRVTQSPVRTAISQSSQAMLPGSPVPKDGFDELVVPSLHCLAKNSVLALAQGLLRDTIDPVRDIWLVGCFINSVSHLLFESDYERAGSLLLLADEQAQLCDRDRDFVSQDAAELREKIRQAAIEYINDPLNKAPAP